MIETIEIIKRAKKASSAMIKLSSDDKNRALKEIIAAIGEEKDKILEQNKIDLINAKGKISDVMLDRLMLDEKRISSMQKGIEEIIDLPDPAGKILSEIKRGELLIKKIAVPLGVVAIIYESRPNVTSDAASLCLKSGNACVLRSGKEAYNTAKAIVDAMRHALKRIGLCEDMINLVEDTTRESANVMMKAKGYIDLLIPRGGKGLIKACVDNATVPCIETGTGICHIFVDESADLQMAINIINNAKTSRPSVCNACEVVLVHEKIKDKFLPMLYDELVTKRKNAGLIPVELRIDEAFSGIIDGNIAGENDFDTEFLDYILALKQVSNLEEAIEHIAIHSTHHSEAIITSSQENADLFLKTVDSAACYHNCSTRFTDGGEFGLGCEMGISTQKLHARGPMGLEELCTYKYIIEGNGNIR